MFSCFLCQKNEVKYSFIAQYKKIWPVVVMCQVLDVKSNNFYSFQKRKVSAAGDPTHQEMIALIKDIAKFSDILMAML
jgi:putative transposase